MAFQPGQSGNPAGKPKGAKNKTSEQLRRVLREFLSANLDSLQESYNELDPKDKMKFIVDLVRVVLPPPVSIERLTPEQMQDLYEQIKIKFDGEQTADVTAN
jgi:hypothetical protein